MLGILSCTLGFLSVDQRSSPPSAVLGGWAALLLCATHLLLGIVSRLRLRRAVFDLGFHGGRAGVYLGGKFGPPLRLFD